AANAEGYGALLAELGPADLEREVSYRNSAGRAFESTVVDLLMHVALHGSYHRGQIALLLREGGAEPSATDYVAFIRGAPAPRAGSEPAPAGTGAPPLEDR